ncbi:MAG: cell division protein FtsA [Spirosomataceae bacterium]
MKNDAVVVGLDIGTTKVRAVAGRLTENEELEIMGVGEAKSDGVIRGSIQNTGSTTQAINKAIKQAGDQAKINVLGVIVNVSGANVQIRSLPQVKTITRDIVTVNDVDEIIRDVRKTAGSLGRSIVHVLPQEYSLGDVSTPIFDPVDWDGTKLEGTFRIVSTSDNDLQKIQLCLQRCQPHPLDSEELVLSPLAASMAVLSNEDRRRGVALVDIGGNSTEVVVYSGNIIRHIALIPWGGNLLTKDIEKGCRVLEEQAENLKVKFGKALQKDVPLNESVAVQVKVGRPPEDILLKNIAIILEQRLLELAALVANEIKKSGYEGRLFNGIVLTGGTAKLPLIEKLFEEVLDEYVWIGKPTHRVSGESVGKVQSPEYATAVGLVWRGFEEIDSREEKYKELRGVKIEIVQKELPKKTPTTNTPVAPTPPPPPAPEEEKKNIIQKLLSWGKDILTDDRVGDSDKY